MRNSSLIVGATSLFLAAFANHVQAADVRLGEEKEKDFERWQTAFSAEYYSAYHHDRDIDTIALNTAVGYYPYSWLGLFGQLSLLSNSGYSTDDWNPALGQMEEDSFGAGAGLMVRLHFVDTGRFRVFGEGTLGGVWHDKAFPTHGTRWNIMSRFGGSIAFQVSSRAMLELGYRHLHISNLKLKIPGGNPALDSHGISFGLNYRF